MSTDISYMRAIRTDGIGSSKIREVTARAAAAKQQGIEISDFSIGRPNFDTPAHIKEACIKAMRDGQIHYCSSTGTREFQEAVAYRIHEDYKIDVDPDNVMATNGASQGLYMTMQAILNPGDEVIVPEPMYTAYSGLSFLAGGSVVRIRTNDKDGFKPTAALFEEKITPHTKALLITSPNNPCGQVIDKEELYKIAELAHHHNLLVIADDIYCRIIYDGVECLSIASVPGMLERTIIVGSLSKTYAMDGWRIGYLILPECLRAGFLKLQQHIISCPNTFVQAGAVAALTGDQSCVDEMVAEFDRRRLLIMKYLNEHKVPYVRPQGAFYIFPDFSDLHMESTDLAFYMLEHARVAAVPGGAFGPDGEGHLRLAYSTDYEDIDAGMSRMMQVVEQLRCK